MRRSSGLRAATRASLLRSTRRLDQVQRGVALLKRKQQSLAQELFRRARTAIESREALEAQALRAWRSVWSALASGGVHGLSPLGWPTREIDVDLRTADLWGVRAVELLRTSKLVRGVSARGVLPDPGAAVTADAARDFELLLERLIEAAPGEQTVRRLGDALAHTTRLVNTLEQRVARRLSTEVTEIRRTLAEREREEQLRIKHLIDRRRARVGSSASTS